VRYMGGKHRQGPAIAAAVMARHAPGASYYEPFCGGLGSAVRAVPLVSAAGGHSFLSDGSEAVVTMWRAVLDGWMPPEHVGREEYERVKVARDPRDPLTAFCGFGCSFSARWFASYVNSAKSSRASVLKKAATLEGYKFSIRHLDYRQVQPRGGAVVYLDPPYENRSKVHDFDSFDYEVFWDYARRLVHRGNHVIVTGFAVPDDWRSIFSWGDTISRPMGNAAVNVVDERIFVHESQFVEDLV